MQYTIRTLIAVSAITLGLGSQGALADNAGIDADPYWKRPADATRYVAVRTQPAQTDKFDFLIKYNP